MATKECLKWVVTSEDYRGTEQSWHLLLDLLAQYATMAAHDDTFMWTYTVQLDVDA